MKQIMNKFNANIDGLKRWMLQLPEIKERDLFNKATINKIKDLMCLHSADSLLFGKTLRTEMKVIDKGMHKISLQGSQKLHKDVTK